MKRVVLYFILLVNSAVLAQNHNHPYPRLGVFHFGSATNDWYARFDLIITPDRSPDFATELHRLNPNAVITPTSGWTAWISTDAERFPEPTNEHWLAVTSTGDKISTGGESYLIDLSNLCPQYNGKRYNQAFGEFILSITDMNYFDGVASDWLWYKPHGVEDIDLDRNGRNDYDEHGSDWVNARWDEGVETLLTNLRNLMPPDKYIICNSGLFHEYGWDKTNGLILEHTTGLVGWDSLWRHYKNWMDDSRQPHFLLVDARPHGGEPNMPNEEKNYYQLMRFLLTVTLLGDGYFNFFETGAGEHHYHRYYDEYDVGLGYPASSAAELSNGCYARFFDHGAVLTNPTGSTQTVTNGMLTALNGYSGPYYRFAGGQDPAYNNGQQFTSITLDGFEFDGRSYGDGIILTSEPSKVVSDIIVDNLDYSTSPGSKPARFTGNWIQTDDGRDAYRLIKRARKDWYPHAYSAPGNGENIARFVPTIGVAGEYEVFEWHGSLDNMAVASDASFRVVSADGVVSRTVDLNRNRGRWNSLGRYHFSKGEAGFVEITNKASGAVLADAVKFVFMDGSEPPILDAEAPASPTGLRITK